MSDMAYLVRCLGSVLHRATPVELLRLLKSSSYSSLLMARHGRIFFEGIEHWKTIQSASSRTRFSTRRIRGSGALFMSMR